MAAQNPGMQTPSSGFSGAGVQSGVATQSQLPSPIQLPTGFFNNTLKLDESNYVLWKGQVLAALVGGGYEDFIYGTTQPPPLFLDDLSQVPNPDHKLWHRTDKSVMSFLFSSLSREPLSQVVCCTSAHAVWESLKQRFESSSTTRVINLRTQMQQVKKEGKTMQQYINTVKMFADQLSAIGETVQYKDYIWYLLEGLPMEYDPIVTAVYSRPDQPSIEEIQNLLLNFDLRVEKRHVSDCVLPQCPGQTTFS
ncbi:hypothetical protein MLD38_034759 [Melastoma candidum]|uniref:Uncharacterized protein n=1 Tax=Melastoma candidum TaxID=119954 RepID=A0ACB9MDF0_9MYRT|nr:hypothetical protein MLD38_034759 [Melastoma candidum]